MILIMACSRIQQPIKRGKIAKKGFRNCQGYDDGNQPYDDIQKLSPLVLQLAIVQNHIENTDDPCNRDSDNERCIQPVPYSKRIKDKGKTEHTENSPVANIVK